VSLAELAGLILSFNLLTFGNGPVMVPLLQRHLVQDSGVLTLDQFLYAFAVGRVTPGQANLYVAAIGYMTYGLPGALLTMAAITLPGYAVLPLVRGYERFRDLPAVQGFVRGLTCVSVGLMLAAVVDIGRATLTGAAPVATFALTLVLVLLRRWNALLAMIAASGAGFALKLLLPG
jgi:chromate transport protein ChrA